MDVNVCGKAFEASSLRRLVVSRIRFPKYMGVDSSDEVLVRRHKHSGFVFIAGSEPLAKAMAIGLATVKARILTPPRYCFLKDGSKHRVHSGVRSCRT
jgi:hypothetical protein